MNNKEQKFCNCKEDDCCNCKWNVPISGLKPPEWQEEFDRKFTIIETDDKEEYPVLSINTPQDIKSFITELIKEERGKAMLEEAAGCYTHVQEAVQAERERILEIIEETYKNYEQPLELETEEGMMRKRVFNAALSTLQNKIKNI